MDVTYGFFWHIIIIKDAAPTSLESLKHKLLTSLEGPWSCPTLLLVGTLPWMRWDGLSPKSATTVI